MPKRLGDAPIEPGLVGLMNAFAHELDEVLNPGLKGDRRRIGFILMLFPFGEEPNPDTHRCNYISNAQRADVVQLLKEQLARFEGQPEMKGNA